MDRGSSKPWRFVAKGCHVLSEDSQLPQLSAQWHTQIGSASLARSYGNCFNKAIFLYGIECPEDRLYQHQRSAFHSRTQDGTCRNIGQCKVLRLQRMSCTDFMSPVVNTKTPMNCSNEGSIAEEGEGV